MRKGTHLAARQAPRCVEGQSVMRSTANEYTGRSVLGTIRKGLLYTSLALMLSTLTFGILTFEIDPIEYYKSTDRSCERWRIANGSLDVHFDAGHDVMAPQTESYSFGLITYKAEPKKHWQFIDISVSILLLAAAFGLYPLMDALYMRQRLRRRIRRGLCLQCGYDLKGNERRRCPICGVGGDEESVEEPAATVAPTARAR